MDITALREAHPEHWKTAAAIRALALDAVAAAKSGHSGMPMGMADVATVLFGKHLKFAPKQPHWPDRDRFILSNGHGSMLLYSVLHLTGYEQASLEELKNFRQWGYRTAGHPEYEEMEGVEATTGPLGQGISMSVGFAIAEEHLRARFGPKVMDHRTWVFAGDGCLMEGVSHEACALAGMQQLGHLTVFFDDNRITIDGTTDLADKTNQIERFEAYGWHTQSIDGHDPEAIDAAIEAAKADPRPSFIACRTHIALGHKAQDTAKGHGALTDMEQLQAAKDAYGWTGGPFEVPDDVKKTWEGFGERGTQAHAEWHERLQALSDSRRKEVERIFHGEPPKALAGRIRALKKQAVEAGHEVATRKSSEMVLEVVNPAMKETIGGSADLTGSNNTLTSDLGVFDPSNRKGRYIHYGVREHGMAAAMNGMALHGGVRPYGGTFMCFTDYARGAMRLSSLMGVPVVYVMTHDSIGLGEDGPTHQPIEHMAMLRATPGLLTFRPADTVETAEAWEIALNQKSTPSVLALSRQNLPPVRKTHSNKNLVAQGAYVLVDTDRKREVILMASGSEVAVALAARDILEGAGIGTRVVSVPSMELFRQQEERYRKRVLPSGPVRIAIEAGVRQPWDWLLLGERGREAKAGFVGMDRFGASAPAEVLYEKFGITGEAAAAKARELLG
ncbi:transketolase [Wenxinia saemankumensis]|uniref:Transketolase n=1 Tax=Wenxinia saemankumensis TaxID=1447782 RepID=A0A1M6D2F1_9RHOB|nr:transketolase [Wenxinia saemankumensis]SHI67293.1 transketolase [Wenxinia saemankumensis]